jgi:HEAT repeat protein
MPDRSPNLAGDARDLSISPRRPQDPGARPPELVARRGSRALPHVRRRGPHALALALLALVVACDRPEAGAGSSDASAQRTVDELVAAFRPVDPTKTSDVEDRAFRERTALLERLRGAGPAVGRAALAELGRRREEALDVQWALLEVAAYNAPRETAPELERLILTYDGERGAGLRTQAVRILAETSPQRAIELYEPLIRDPQAHRTLPPQEELVRGFATASVKLGLGQARVLCDVVVDLRQPPDARYAAANALSEIGGERAILALREVLVEGSSDGNLRRKAAQGLLRIMPRKDLCVLIEETAQHEADPVFIDFLSDMIDKNCAGQ